MDYSAIWRVRRSIFLVVCKFLSEERTTSMSERYVEEACLKLISPLYNVFCFFFSKASSKASRNVISLALLAGIEFPQASFLRCLSFQLSCRYDFFHLSPAGLFHLIVIRKKESFLTGLTLGLCDYCVQTLQLFNQNTTEFRNLEPHGKWEIVKTNCCNSMYANHNISLLTWRCFISPRFSFFISVKRFDWRSCTISR